MFNIGPAELMVIGLVLLIAVGPEQLPSVIRRVGSGVSQIRSMTEGLRSEFMAGLEEIERVTDPDEWTAYGGESSAAPQERPKPRPRDSLNKMPVTGQADGDEDDQDDEDEDDDDLGDAWVAESDDLDGDELDGDPDGDEGALDDDRDPEGDDVETAARPAAAETRAAETTAAETEPAIGDPIEPGVGDPVEPARNGTADPADPVLEHERAEGDA